MKILRARLAICLVIVLAIGGWFAWLHWWNNPSTVFWGMLANNLSTPGVTRVVSQNGQLLSIIQYTQLSLGAQPTAHSLTVFHQGDGTLATEEISDRRSDYVRYQKIAAAQPSPALMKAQALVSQWAKLQSGDATVSLLTSGLFDQSLLGVLPIAPLQPETRAMLLATMHKTGVFSFDPGVVKKVTVAGRQAWRYQLRIKPAVYIAMMQQFERLVGATTYVGLNPAGYAHTAPITVTVDIDARNHQLLRLVQGDTGRTETYQAFGVVDHTSLPKATLTTTQLTERLGNLTQAGQ